MSDFYIGYEPKAPARLGAQVRRTAWLIGTGALALGAVLAGAQNPFADARYEYGVYHPYDGDVLEWPAPMLVTPQGSFLVVAPGKHGASEMLRGHEGDRLHAEASLIARPQGRMLEVKPETLRFEKQFGPGPPARISLGSFTFTGEVIDTKCFLGIMNPGNGKVHRDCAVRCISGGVPPGLLVRDATGDARVLLLAGGDGRAIGRELLDIAGEPVVVTGQLVRSGETLVLEADRTAFRRE